MDSQIKNKIIRLSKSCISESEKKAVIDVLNREYLGMGQEVERFETELSTFFNRQAICVANGTSALHLALQASGVKKEDEVLVPSITYVASFQAISAVGAKPVSCDIRLDNFLLNLEDAAKRITSKTKAIMPVHYTGAVGDLDALYNFAEKNNLIVIEDAAHAFGTVYNNKRIGSFGNIACFSFDGIKNITSGEGGCVVSDNDNVIQKIKDARLLGVARDTEKRFEGKRSWDFDVLEQGWRYHMSNIMAAIGIEQLKRFPEFSKKRKEFAFEYDKNLINENIQLLKTDYMNVVPHIYVVRIIGLKNRIKLQEIMLEKGIQIGYHYQPNHKLSFYKDINIKQLKITDSISSELISLPLHPDLSIDDIRFISKTLINTINNF